MDQTQRTRAQPPGASIGLIGLTDAENGAVKAGGGGGGGGGGE